MTEYNYIDSDAALNSACEEWSKAKFLALDTEFIRTDTFFPIAGLIQVGAAGKLALIDPLTITDWQAFTDLLRLESLPKVLHSCSEDLELFQRLFQCVPQPLFDTQVGAAIAGIGSGLSYQKLVLACLDEHLDKGETRSNWLQRPLTDSQCLYAAFDVLYLQPVYELICDRIEQLGRNEWWLEESLRITTEALKAPDYKQYYKRVKSAWKLAPSQLQVLQDVCAWRELEARERDIPRGRVLKDSSCYDIARLSPSTAEALAKVQDIQSSQLRRYTDVILAMLSESSETSQQSLPERLPKPLSSGEQALMKKMKAVAIAQSEAQDVGIEILAKKRDYESLIRERRLPESMLGWRRGIVGEQLLGLIEKS